MQLSLTVQARPFFVLHAPVASQVWFPMQVSVSSALTTLTQAPPPPVQAWQVPHAATVQQYLSTQ